MKRYAVYKDSGIEWIGDIPGHWKKKRFKYCFSLISEKNEEDLPKVGLENIESWTGNYIETSSEFKGDGEVFQENDILYGKLRPYLAKVYLATFSGKAVGDIFIFRCENSINPRFGHKFILSKNFIEVTNSSTYGSKMPRVAWEFISNLLVCVPPLPEQTAIAAYLDRKTAEIDALIADKKRLLELYEEEKTAIINQAVTKGLDPDAPMKDSGIEWLGEVPEEWEVKRLRYLGWCQNGIGISSDAFGKGYPFVSYSDVGNNETIPIEVKGLVESSSSDRRKYSVEEGDVFFTRTSETVEEIAYASTCLKTIEDAVFAGFLIRWRPFSNLLDNRFKKYYFRAQVHRRFLALC